MELRTVSTGVDSARSEPGTHFANVLLLLGIAVAICSVALALRTYSPCPFCDAWEIATDIARGRMSWVWLWSQHNEHRIVIPRLLTWLDWTLFGGRNISLLIEIFVIQALHWLAISYAIVRFTTFPRALKRTLQGLFLFCLFYPNQTENFTWGFQVGFILPFAIASLTFLAIAFLDRLPYRRAVLAGAACAPLIAAMNIAGGLLIGPTAFFLARMRRSGWRLQVLIAGAFTASTLLYVYGYHSPGYHSWPLASAGHPLMIAQYALTYIGASFRPAIAVPWLGLASVSTLLFLLIRAIRRRDQVTSFEWFCLAECVFVIQIACLTALGRLRFGVEQAFAGRYQTPAMIYWACFFSLLFISVWHHRGARLLTPAWLLAPVGLWIILIPAVWGWYANSSDLTRRACDSAVQGKLDGQQARYLDHSQPDLVSDRAALLRSKWSHR